MAKHILVSNFQNKRPIFTPSKAAASSLPVKDNLPLQFTVLKHVLTHRVNIRLVMISANNAQAVRSVGMSVCLIFVKDTLISRGFDFKYLPITLVGYHCKLVCH